jgi:hypothetical protein
LVVEILSRIVEKLEGFERAKAVNIHENSMNFSPGEN